MFIMKKLLVFLLIIYFGSFVLFSSPVVVSDGYCYYHIARSIVDKGNFISDTKPDYYDYKGHVIVYTDNVYKDVCSPGTAFALVPGLMISKAVSNDSVNQYNDYFESYSGHSLSDGISMILTSVVFATASFYYLYKLAKLLTQNKSKQLLLISAVVLSSFITNYIFIRPYYTHIYEFSSAIIFLYNILQYSMTKDIKNLIVAGISVSFGFSVRPFFAIPSALTFAWLMTKKKVKPMIAFALANIPFIALVFAYNYVSYGSLITSGYNEIRGETFNYTSSNIIPLFFHPGRGWFIWSPIFILAFIGYFLKIKHRKMLFIDNISLATVLLTCIMYSFWPAWHGGGSFGARFMIMNAPFMIFGLDYFFSSIKKKFVKRVQILSVLMIAYSAFFSFLCLFTPYDSPKARLLFFVTNYRAVINNPINFMLDSRLIVDSKMGFLDLALGTSTPVVKIDDRTQSEIGLLAFDYNPGARSVPKDFVFYVKNNINGKHQKFKIDLSSLSSKKSEAFLLKCNSESCSENSDLIEEQMDFNESELRLSKDLYNMFVLNNNPYSVYITRDNRINEVGPNKVILSDTEEFFP